MVPQVAALRGMDHRPLLAAVGLDGDDTLPFHVVLPHRPRLSARQYEDRLKSAVTLRPGDAISISFDARHLALPNRAHLAADPVASGALTAGDIALDDAALVAAMQRTFAPVAVAGRLSLAHVAAMLGFAQRSLQRRLGAMNLAFGDLADSWRRDEARRLLAGTPMPVADVARLLGYADPAHLTRAFHRWEGLPPAPWRRDRA